MSPRPHERELTPAAVAQLVGCHPRTVRRWIHWGHIRARTVTTKSGVTRYRISSSEIERSRIRSYFPIHRGSRST
jgi:excisionase family DNA binding protein